jgi:hypothetical protein
VKETKILDQRERNTPVKRLRMENGGKMRIEVCDLREIVRKEQVLLVPRYLLSKSVSNKIKY